MYYCNKKERESKLKNICNVNVAIGLPGKEKAKKQEIRRVHNSNPLQRHEHVPSSGLLLIRNFRIKYRLGKPVIANSPLQDSE